MPEWHTPGEVAAALGLRPSELDWFADARGWNRRAADPLRNYRYRWVTPTRLIEAPKPRLAEVQRRLLRHVLSAIPLHEAAHGFRPGRSVHTFARPHAGRPTVVRVDLARFFSTITAARVRALFATAGYRHEVAAVLAALCTTAAPAEVANSARDWTLRRALAAPHLPQGAPTSPAIANAIAFRLDTRLAGLAARLGARYTRYADDLAFSLDTGVHRLLPAVTAIAADEGFRVHPAKTRVAAAHQRQRLAGLVVNHSPAAPRDDFDALRALLHNCARTGPAAQNRDGHSDFRAHLLGRIAWTGAASPARAAKLKTLFDRIAWQ
nr:reverse transcriptase family protein [Actinokineospora sp. NBRC 105648]